MFLFVIVICALSLLATKWLVDITGEMAQFAEHLEEEVCDFFNRRGS